MSDKTNPLDSYRDSGLYFSPTRNTLTNLLSKEFSDTAYICKPFISEGLMIFAGRPKIGKTTLLRSLMLRASNGGDFLGKTCEVKSSLFLSLEESERMAKRKFDLVKEGANTDLIDVQFCWPRGSHGIEALRSYLSRYPEIRLVVIDCLTKFRELDSKPKQQFQQDYETVAALHELTKEFSGLALVVLHHTTKANFEDPIDSISGSYGITAAVDSYGVLQSIDGKYRLSLGGRYWDEDTSDFELERKDGDWLIVGEWDTDVADLPLVRGRILTVLKEEGVVTNDGLAKRLGISKQTVSEHIKILRRDGYVSKTSDGLSAL